jgi:alkanesulfonate monooxygenase SsuD/methylene tetrahydromethanopterin reductase-like flavin-dependent oxidoreductase (luciferase family)
MRYENPLYMAEDAGAADLISDGRLQLGLSRGSPEQVTDGWRHFGYAPAEGESDAEMGRRHAQVFLEVLRGQGLAQPNPRPMFPNPPGLLRLEPHSEGLRERIWWGSGSNATAVWAAQQGMNLQSSTLKDDETGEPFHIQQARQIRAYHAAWKEAGHVRTPRVSVSRSIFPLLDDRDRAISAGAPRRATRSAFSTRRPAPSSAAATLPSPTRWSSSSAPTKRSPRRTPSY